MVPAYVCGDHQKRPWLPYLWADNDTDVAVLLASVVRFSDCKHTAEATRRLEHRYLRQLWVQCRTPLDKTGQARDSPPKVTKLQRLLLPSDRPAVPLSHQPMRRPGMVFEERYLFTALNPNKIEPSNKGLDKSPRFV